MEKLNNVFGFLVNQPFHKSWRQLRVLGNSIGVFFMILLWSMWVWFMMHHQTMTTQSAGVFGSLVLLVGGSLKMILDNSKHKHESDD